MLVIEDFVNQNEVRAMRDEISRLVEEMNPTEHRGVFSTTSRSQVCKSKNYRCPAIFCCQIIIIKICVMRSKWPQLNICRMKL